MALCARVDQRNVALTITQLSMRCGPTELPLPLDDAPAERFTGSARLRGEFDDAVSGSRQSCEFGGPVALSVVGGRLIGIVAPDDGARPAIWFSVPLGKARVDVLDRAGVRKKPVGVRISFDTIVVEVTAIHKLLKTMQQAGQGAALVEALERGRADSDTMALAGPPSDVFPAPVAIEPVAPVVATMARPPRVDQPVVSLPLPSPSPPEPATSTARRPVVSRGSWIAGVIAVVATVVAVVAVKSSGDSNSDRNSSTTVRVPAPAAKSTTTTSNQSTRTTTTIAALPDRPPEWPSPTSEVSTATAAFVGGPGGDVTLVVGLITELVDQPIDPSACSKTIGALDARVSPPDFLTTVAATPDPILGGLLAGLVTVTGDSLKACVAGSASDDSFAPVRATLRYIQLRTSELGISG